MTNPPATDHRERLQNALLAIQRLQARVGELEGARAEPVAVVGLDCRFPGGADSPEAFWRLLRDGVDAISEVPATRFPVDEHFDSDPDAPGRTYSRWGGFVGEVDRFDPHFWGISPREAVSIDPQHRMLLEVGWSALERAGIAPSSLAGARAGVYVGITGSDYASLVRGGGAERLDAYSAIGSTSAFIAGRLSYVLGLQGPSIAVDTACSSSLAAVHLACQALRAGDCDLAIAGGVNLMLTPEMWITTSKNRMLSPTGRCRTFDAAADGFVRGEGCGVVVLKRLSRALADGDTVLATVRGWAMNQDGASSGITVPNRMAQEAAIRGALAAAGVRPHEVGYVEAHGTGTPLGDPIEMRALAAVLGEGRAAETPLLVGSVKTNIGHLEAASGIAGLIKTVLALRHGEIPPHLHLGEPSPHIPWAEIPIRVPGEATPWPGGETPRVAGVSSFGASGTNVHLVLGEPPPLAPRPEVPERPAHLLPLSARTPAELRVLARRFRDRLGAAATESAGEVCHTAGVGRNHFAHRVAVVGGDAAALSGGLDAWLAGEAGPGVAAGEARPGARPRVALLFTGQGAQYVGMGRRLWQTEPVFRAALERCALLLEPRLGRPLAELLFPPAEREAEAAALLDRTEFTQPALFALEWALWELWRAWGVEPYAVMGHSVGEYVAACVAGVFSLEDGLELIAERGARMGELPAGGAMAAVRLDADSAAAAIERSGSLAVAAVNGPQSAVLSGDRDELERVVGALRDRGVECRMLTVSHAFHSPLVEPALPALQAAAARIELREPRLRLVSNRTGSLAGAEPARPEYWRGHAREPVRFADGVRTLRELGCDAFLEVGPAPVLLGMARECVAEERTTRPEPLWLPSLRRDREATTEMLGSLARLYVAGADVDWQGLDRERGRRRVWLPTYPFAGDRYWVDDTPASPVRPRAAGEHPLLGARVATAGRERVWEARLGADRPGYLGDHRVRSAVVLPAAAFIEMAIAAAATVFDARGCDLRDVVLHEPLTLPEHGEVAVQLVATASADDALEWKVFSADGEAWRLHASGVTAPVCHPEGAQRPKDLGHSGRSFADAQDDSMRWHPEGAQRPKDLVDASDHYSALAARGLDFGEAFRGVRRVWRAPGAAVAEAALPASLRAGADAYRLHPVLFDACLQAVGAALEAPADHTFLPLGFERLRFHRPLRGTVTASAEVSSDDGAGATVSADLVVHDDTGALCVEVERLSLRRLAEPADDIDAWLYDVVWESQPIRLSRESGNPGSTQGDAEPPPIADLLEPLRTRAAALVSSADAAALRTLRPGLDRLCAAYVWHGLRRLGWDPAARETVHTDEMAARLGIAPRHHRLLTRLLEILAEDGVLEPTDAGAWRVAATLDELDPADLLDRLGREVPDAAPELGILQRCGDALPEALRGEADPLELLFPGGSLGETERMYRSSPMIREANRLVADAVATLAAAAAAHTSDRPLRVLEIGGGTGGTTAHVLPLLPGTATEYTFTDVSPLFVERAERTFGEHAWLNGAVLDISRDPQPQGFAPGGYDLVIASNVLHATAELPPTLGHVRRLLAPGGSLVLLEGITRNRFADLTVGLTEGWWCFDDGERDGYALVEAAHWQRLLAAQGLQAMAVVPPEPFADQALIVGRAPAAADALADTGEPGSWLILADAGGTGERLAVRLAELGHSPVLVRPEPATPEGRPERAEAAPRVEGPSDSPKSVPARPAHALDPTDPAAFRRLVSDLTAHGQPPLRGAVHLWALDDVTVGASAAGQTPTAARVDELDVALARVTGGALHLTQALVAGGVRGRLLLVTRGTQPADAAEPVDALHAALWGVGKAVTVEHPELGCRRVDLELGRGAPDIDALLAELLATDDEDAVALRDGHRLVARLQRRHDADAVPNGSGPDDALLESGVPYALVSTGDRVLDGLRYTPAERATPGHGEVEVEVHATGLTFRDVLNALGQYPDPDAPLGGELAGVVSRVGPGVDALSPGDRVFGIAAGGFRSHAATRAELLAPVPSGLTLPQAAALPSAFLTAVHALEALAALRAGERVLIHAAAGGVGLAAIQIALRAGAEVIATAGSTAKREHLRSLGVKHVFDSRSLGFADDVRSVTDGAGVDVVLNSLADAFVERSWEVLAEGGRFVELGKRGIRTPERARQQRPDARYFVVDLAAASAREPAVFRRLFERTLDGFADGSLRPLPVRVFPAAQTIEAFRFMAQARQTGKVVVAHPRPTAIRGDATYLITGGLGGVGLAVARWLVDRGARHLALVGRSAPSEEAAAALRAMEADGAHVEVVRADVSRAEHVDRLFATIERELPPLRGVFHGALVLDDGALTKLSWERFRRVLDPRVRGAWLLHARTAARPLDFFVLFSAAGSLIGSAGQANYTAANTALDALAAHRRGLGLPGLSVQWGLWEGVGRAAELGYGERAADRGIGAMAPDRALVALDRVIRRTVAAPQVAVMAMEWPALLASQRTVPPLLRRLAAERTRAPAGARHGPHTPTPSAPRGADPAGAPATRDLRAELDAAPSARRLALLRGHARSMAVRVLGLAADHPLDERQPLQELGLDSLMAVELRTLLGAGLGLPRPLPATLAFDHPSVEAIAGYLHRQLFGDEAAETPQDTAPTADEPGSEPDGLGAISDDEAEAMLLAELESLRGGASAKRQNA